MNHRLTLAVLAALAAPLPALAQNAPADDNNTGWSGKGELGLAVAKGNTDNETFVGKLDFGYSNDEWKYAFGGAAQYAKDDEVESARRYELYGTAGRRLSDRSYIFASLRNERDHFTSYEYQTTAAVGYGYEAIKNDNQHLTFEIGPGYRWTKLQGVQIQQNDVIGRGLVDWGVKLTPTTQLIDTLLVESGSDNTFAKNLFGVQVAMTDALALKAGLETRHNTDVLPGIKKTDNLTTVNLVYNIK
ncbi:MAG: DUF481 domain-containing protein [Pseudoxanthomonas sp.]